MKKTVWTLLIAPMLAYSQVVIASHEELEGVLQPDELQGSFAYEAEGMDPDAIKRDLNAIVVEAKKRDPQSRWCRGGGYSVVPQYRYRDQKREFAGYIGNLTFECVFGGIEEYNAFGEAIEKKRSEGVRKTLRPLTWQVSKRQKKQMMERLEYGLIAKARERARSFSAASGMECALESIDMSKEERVFPREGGIALMKSAVPTESPLQSDESLTADATVHYRCTSAGEKTR